MNTINLSRYQLELRLFLSKRSAKGARAKARVIILLRLHRAACAWVIATCKPVWPIFPFLATRNALTSSNKKLGWCCLDYLSGRFGYQETLLSINLDDKNILQRTLKQFGPVATKK